MTAGMLAQHDRVLRDADRLGRHDLVGLLVGQHAMLVDAGLMRECVCADDRLGRGDRHAGDGLIMRLAR